MKKDKRILEEVEKTINSINEIKNLEENPFLHTRIKSALESKSFSLKKKSIFVFKPVVVGLVIIINIITTVYFLQADHDSYTSNETLIETLSNDYKINQSYYEFISLN